MGEDITSIVKNPGGELKEINWPRMILVGPFEKAPFHIYRKGFQGFRYVYENEIPF